ncbi:MAG: SPOCS domain-containing protein [Sedimentibacter sp.]
MFKLISDTFNINEIIDSISTEVLLENEFTLADGAPDIEKVISTEGKVKINNAEVNEDAVKVDGTLTYNIIYRSNDEEVMVSSASDKIYFTEEIPFEGAMEGMKAQVEAYIDYIDAEQQSERSYLVKAVVLLDTDVANSHPVNFVSNLESDGTFQAKTKNIAYTDQVSVLSEEVNINDAVELNKSSDEIAKILKAESEVFITNIDTLDDKMLIEGTCKVGFLYTEDNTLNTTGYVSEEFPFTHYLEVKNSNDDMTKDINVTLSEMSYNIAENYDNEKKLIEFNLPFTINAAMYDTVEKNIITDCYSTDCLLDMESQNVNLTSLKELVNKTVKYENTFDVISGSIKDIYTVDVSPKISEKKVFDDKYVVDGFLDVNLLYLNGDINKIDKAYASLPFTASIDLKENQLHSDITSNVKISKSGAYRKGSNSVIVNCDINVDMKLRNKDEISVISNITETGPIDRSKMPSLVFRVVQPGETVWDIAKNYNLSINYLKELNEIPADNVLQPGSKIIIARMV